MVNNTRHTATLLAPVLALCLAGIPSLPATAQATGAPLAAPGATLSQDQLQRLLPPSVYFEGKSAPLQIRNSGAVVFPGNAPLWVALVDTSGYASSVQERYQFYLVTEGPLRIGESNVPAGVYGGGFQGDHFILMDVGGHTLAQGPVQTDAAMNRPRPLQLVSASNDSAKLYLGRHWVLLQAGQE